MDTRDLLKQSVFDKNHIALFDLYTFKKQFNRISDLHSSVDICMLCSFTNRISILTRRETSNCTWVHPRSSHQRLSTARQITSNFTTQITLDFGNLPGFQGQRRFRHNVEPWFASCI